MEWKVLELAVSAIEALRPVVEKIERKDRDLAKQIRTAASSVALNAGEGILGRKGHRDERLYEGQHASQRTGGSEHQQERLRERHRQTDAD